MEHCQQRLLQKAFADDGLLGKGIDHPERHHYDNVVHRSSVRHAYHVVERPQCQIVYISHRQIPRSSVESSSSSQTKQTNRSSTSNHLNQITQHHNHLQIPPSTTSSWVTHHAASPSLPPSRPRTASSTTPTGRTATALPSTLTTAPTLSVRRLSCRSRNGVSILFSAGPAAIAFDRGHNYNE
jgi:hypothetical protein